ncbi:hypothetical protein OROMI_009065 [Orobanche minor]
MDSDAEEFAAVMDGLDGHLCLHATRRLQTVLPSDAAGDAILVQADGQRGAGGGYHFQGRNGKVILGVPKKSRGDPAKWFWVGGAWRLVANDISSAELYIPTGFRPKATVKGIRITSADELDFDFSVIRDWIKKLPDDHIDARLLNTQAPRLAARVFHFPRFLVCNLLATYSRRVIAGDPFVIETNVFSFFAEVYFPRFKTASDFEMTKKNIGVLVRFKPGKRDDRSPETNRAVVARSVPLVAVAPVFKILIERPL